jgi:4-amino-4-deoxy-L-arabinose transferase-like glycosyltransferase
VTGETRDRFLLAALAASALALLWRFQAEPFHHGYTRYAGLAAEMLRSGDWLVMRAAGHPYFNKPPLYAWLIAAPMIAAVTTCQP